MFALDLPHTKVGVPYTDFIYCISQYIVSTWQDDWNGASANTLHSVKPVLGDWQSSYRRCRKDEIVLCCPLISHTHLTHSYILNKDPPPQCEHCQCILTVRHILVSAIILLRKKGKIYLVKEMWNPLDSIPLSFCSIKKSVSFICNNLVCTSGYTVYNLV